MRAIKCLRDGGPRRGSYGTVGDWVGWSMSVRDGGPRRGSYDTIGLYVEYAERANEYGILFIVSMHCEYTRLAYVRIYAIYRVYQAEYVIHMRVAASQEYVNTYSTRRTVDDWLKWSIYVCVLCGSPVWPSPPVVGPLRGPPLRGSGLGAPSRTKFHQPQPSNPE